MFKVCIHVGVQVRLAQQHRDHLKREDRAVRKDGAGVPRHLVRETAESEHNLQEVRATLLHLPSPPRRRVPCPPHLRYVCVCVCARAPLSAGLAFPCLSAGYTA